MAGTTIGGGREARTWCVGPETPPELTMAHSFMQNFGEFMQDYMTVFVVRD